MNPPNKQPKEVASHTDDSATESVEGNVEPTNAIAIKQISIEGLFGEYSYVLPSSDDERDLTRLFVLHGDNGSGKTTILKLVYHALSPEDRSGHRSFLASTSFHRLAIALTDGTVFEAQRNVDSSGGSLIMSVIKDSRTVASAELGIDKDLSLTPDKDNKSSERMSELLLALKELHIRLHYLSDDRKHQGTISLATAQKERMNLEMLRTFNVRKFETAFRDSMDQIGVPEPDDADALVIAMAQLTRWADKQVRKGATKGQGDTDSIYSKVLFDIAHSLDTPPVITGDANRLVDELKHLERKSLEYSKYGLVREFSAKPLIISVREATERTLPVFYNVMKPYVDGINARLTALESVYSTINHLLESINSFFKNKRVSFDIDRGLAIRSVGAGQHKLDPSMLSSGERQLLLLFCNTILARGQASLFIIDEPELSLNVKWQRSLIQSLLDNTKGSNVQFLLATHSMELISQHRPNVVKLMNYDTQ